MTGFALWAPEATRVRLRLPDDPDRELVRGDGGWWRITVPGAGPGTDYSFLLGDDDTPLPDPRCPWQPDAAGPSRVYDHAAFAWTDQGWTGRRLLGGVLYQLHVGMFTPGGTFDDAIERLDHLVELGVDLIELLAVNGSGGVRDTGLSWYAPDHAYGGPDGLKRFVDAAHDHGLGVILDVVYHRAALSGPYAPSAGSRALALRHHLLDSALTWLREYHVDGLRLTAVPVLVEQRAPLLEEMAEAVEALSSELGRPLSLVAESDRDEPRLITPRQPGDHGRHARHPLPSLLTGSQRVYRADLGFLQGLGDVLSNALVHAGTWSARHARTGQPMTGQRFVAYLRDRDQTGDAARGDRPRAAISPGLLRVGATLLLTSPFTPMLFMGEEWGASTPWPLLTSQPEPELAAAVAGGRRREPVADGRPAGEPPDQPGAASPVRGRLDWAERDLSPHRETLNFYRRLIALRRSRPELSDPRLDRVEVYCGDQFVVIRRARCLVAANLAPKPQRVTLPEVVRAVLLASGAGVIVMRDGVQLPAESAVVVA